VAAAGYLPMPQFTEPDSSDPEARLEFYSRGIVAVQYAARANHERAEQQRLIGLGLRLKAIKEEELHKTAGFDTFGDLTWSRFQIKKHQANNIIRVLGVAQALEDITTQELKERPLRVLVPILDTHGVDAVRKTWQEAARHGNVTDTALKQAATFLGYAPPKVLDSVLEAPVVAKPKELPAKPSESLQAVERIRTLAQQDLEQARREAEQLESAVRELLEELSGNSD
jgi:nucleotide-binding universal stress UspA family protein